MIWLRRIAWIVMWCGLLLAVALHHDMVAQEPGERPLVLFGFAIAGIVLGLIGAHFTKKSTEDGWGP
jgi:hypothetical protein